MSRKKEAAVLLWVVVSSGCTMGLGETTRFVTRNVSLSGALADGEFALEDGVAMVVVDQLGPEFGVTITIEGADQRHDVQAVLDVGGDLGALCPGMSVELARAGGSLVPVGIAGGTPDMAAPLMGLAVNMNAQVIAPAREDIDAQHLVLSAEGAEDGFSRMVFSGTTVIAGEDRTITGAFDIARVLDDIGAPSWDADSWEGQPIAQWE